MFPKINSVFPPRPVRLLTIPSKIKLAAKKKGKIMAKKTIWASLHIFPLSYHSQPYSLSISEGKTSLSRQKGAAGKRGRQKRPKRRSTRRQTEGSKPFPFFSDYEKTPTVSWKPKDFVNLRRYSGFGSPWSYPTIFLFITYYKAFVNVVCFLNLLCVILLSLPT